MQRFKYEDNELIPILQAGITVNGSPVEIVDSALAVTLKPVTVLWSVHLIFRKAEKKIKQDERVEQTKSVAKEEGVYFY